MAALLRLFCFLPAFFLLSGHPARAQSKPDSLYRALALATRDSDKVDILLAITGELKNNTDSALTTAYRAKSIALAARWESGIARVDVSLGMLFRQQSRNDTALVLVRSAADRFQTLGDERRYAICLRRIGAILFDQGNFTGMIEQDHTALQIQTRLKDTVEMAHCMRGLGLGYSNIGQSDKALGYMYRALPIYKQLKDTLSMAYQYLNIAEDGMSNGKEEQALRDFDTSLVMMKASHDDLGIQFAYGDIATTLNNLKRYDEAVLYSDSTLAVASRLGYKRGMSEALRSKGNAYLYSILDSVPMPRHALPRQAAIAFAIRCFHESLALAVGSATDYQNLFYGYKGLYHAYRLTGDYKAALDAHLKSTEYADSMYSRQTAAKLAAMEGEQALSEKEGELKLNRLALRRKQEEQIFLAAGLLLVLGFGMFAWRAFRAQKRSNRIIAAEQQKSESLLLNILPAEVAEELKNSGASAARHYDEVSVLFTDFMDFTGTAARLSPQALVAELNTCFTAFDAIIERNGLEKIKTIGDAYMAVCGLPVADPDHARKTVQAALDIRDFMEHRRSDAAHRDSTFQIRIGVNSGPVVAGIVGVKKFAYDIWGDTVNTAARMEQHGEAGQINISQSTYELVRADFSCTYRGKVDAKNKGAVEMYFVAGKSVRR